MANRTAHSTPTDPGPGRAPVPRRQTILLAEDDVAVRRVATTILERHGYSVLGAEDGERVLNVFKATRDQVALVVLDQRMPGPGVEAVLTAILTLKPEARILLMSGYTEPDLTPEIRNRLRGFLSKPFQGRELLRAVEVALAD
jgi:two-component system cell cycle sensor histidine kinase/response regulator CckA